MTQASEIDPILKSSFSRLTILLEAFKADKVTYHSAIMDRYYRTTTDFILNHPKSNKHVCQVFSSFQALLSQFSREEDQSYLVLLLMSQYIDRCPGDVDISFPESLISGLLDLLIGCKSCHRSRLLVSIFLDETLSSSDLSRIDINSALHRFNPSCADRLVDGIVLFLSSTNPFLFLTLVVSNLVSFVDNETDQLASLRASKHRYGHLELLGLVDVSAALLDNQLKLLFLVLKRFKSSDMFLLLVMYFYMPSIMRLLNSGPVDQFPEYSNEIFHLLYKKIVTNTGPSLSLTVSPSHPIVSMIHYEILTLLTALNSLIFDKFLKFQQNKLDNISSNNLSPVDIKMFSILIKLVGSSIDTTNDKHILMSSFVVIFQVANRIDPSDPVAGSIHAFIEKYYLNVYRTVSDLLFKLSANTVINNCLVEPVKIDFIVNTFLIKRALFLPLFEHHVARISKDHPINNEDLYGYFVVAQSLRGLSRHINLLNNVLVSIAGFEVFVERMHLVMNIITQTKTSYAKIYARYIHCFKAQLSEDADADSAPSSIYFNPAFLARKIYEICLGFINANLLTYLKLDRYFLKDDEFTDELLDQLATRGFFLSKIVLVGYFDYQSECFEALSQLLLLCLNNEVFNKHYKLYAFLSNEVFLNQFFEQLLSTSFLDSKQYVCQFVFLTQYLVILFTRYAGQIDYENVFHDVHSVRANLYIKLGRECETFLYIFLCTATADTYNSIKRIVFHYAQSMNPAFKITQRIFTEINVELLQAMVADDDVLIRGRKYLRRKVRKLFLLHVLRMSLGIEAALTLAFNKISDYYLVNGNLSDSELEDFSNYASLLAIVSGIDTSPEWYDSMALVNSNNRTTQFVRLLITNLNTKSKKKQQVIEDILAKELNEKICIVLYSHLCSELRSYAKTSTTEILSDATVELIVAYTSILERLFKRLSSLVIFQNSGTIVSISDLLVAILKHQFMLWQSQGTSHSPDCSTHGFARLKLCGMKYLSKFFGCLSDLRIKTNHLIWRNEILRTLLHWLEVSYFKDELNFFVKISPRPGSDSLVRVYLDIVTELLNCIASVTNNLPIVRKGISYQKEVNTLRSIMFGNYYNVIIRILRRSLADNQELAVKNGAAVTASTTVLPTIQPAAWFSSTENLRNIELCVEILSNLVSANYDIGLNYLLTLISDTNPTIQDAFLYLFKRVFSEASAKHRLSDFSSILLGDSVLGAPVAQDSRFALFCYNGICNPDFLIAIRNVVDTVEIDRVATSTVNLLDRSQRLIFCLSCLLKYELKVCLKPLDILRRNTLTTKLISLTGKAHGPHYLKKTIGKLLDEIIVSEDYFEVDQFYQGPNGISNGDSGKFFHYFTKLVNRICESIKDIPQVIIEVCQELRSVMFSQTQDHELSLIVVSTFFFLRFLCPSIASPDELDLINYEPPPQALRCFILLTKAIQNASNGTLTIDKFPLLKGKELEMQSLVHKISNFVDEISFREDSQVPEKTTGEGLSYPNLEVPSFDSTNLHHFKVIYTFVINHAQELRYEITHPRFPQTTSIVTTHDFYTLMDTTFQNIGFQYMVYYPDVADFIRINKNKYIDLYEIVHKSFRTPVAEQITDLKFLVESVAKDGTQVFILTLSYFDGLQIDPEILAARVIQSLCRLSTSTYYVVLDCTLYNHSELLPTLGGMLEILYRVIPAEIAGKCAGVFVVNISYNFAPCLNTLLVNRVNASTLFLNPKHQKFSFLSLFENRKIIESFNLSPWTYNVTFGGKSYTNDILYHDSNGEKTYPVSLKITNSYVIYEFGEVQKLKLAKFTKQFRCVNLEPLVDWSNLTESNSSELSGTFQVTSKLMGNRVLSFASFKREEIIRTFYMNLNSYQVSVYNSSKKLELAEKPINTKELLGEVLISIGIGLMSNHENIRKHAYELLFIIKNHLNRSHQYHSNGFCPPKNVLVVTSILGQLLKDSPELTYEVITAFNYISSNYETIIDTNKDIFLIIEPWIGEVHKEIYLSDKISNGPEIVRTFISGFIRHIPAEKTDVLRINEIWSKLICVDDLVEMILTQVVKEAMFRELSGISSANLLTLILMNPLGRVCYEVLKQIIGGTTLDVSIRQQTARIELFWLRIELLFKIAVPLFFESVVFVESYLAEILFVCSIYHRNGTRPVKNLVHQFTVNCFATLSLNRGFSAASQKILKDIYPQLTGSKASFIFGLTTNSSFFEDSSSLNRLHSNYYASKTLNFIATTVLSLPEYQRSKEYAPRVARCVALTTELAFNDSSLFQLHGLRLLGHLTHLGIDDAYVSQYIRKTVAYFNPAYPSFSFPTLVMLLLNLGKLVEGVNSDSRYYGMFYNVGLGLTFLDNVVFFESGMFIFSRLTHILNVHGFFDRDMWSKYKELEKGIELTQHGGNRLFYEDLDGYLTYIVTKVCSSSVVRGLHFCFCKDITAIRILSRHTGELKLQQQLSQTFERGINEPAEDFGFLGPALPIFLLSETAESFHEYMKSCGFGDILNYVQINEKDQIPKILVEFLLIDTQASNLTLILISLLFCNKDLDLKVKMRYLSLVKYLSVYQTKVLKLVFPIINQECYSICEVHPTKLDLIILVNEIQAKSGLEIFNDADGRPHYLNLLEQYDISLESLLMEFFLPGVEWVLNALFANPDLSEDPSMLCVLDVFQNSLEEEV